ncbi:Hypothetical predicted protein [Cloeon dipterum]|uniref:Uncharacterized protein n=1 Tax=Cloeon dipterum TaxID=197152 RepID=A0A8S1CKR5_9INSE|nr:Hypothetical predicted protein [Cloeon dipterum]
MEFCLIEKKAKKLQDEEMDVLHSAAKTGNSPLVKSLLEEGEDPVKTRKNGWTALHYAAKSGDIQSVKLLIEWGDKRLLNLKTISGLTSLHIAAMNADVEMCKLLMDSGVDINATTIFEGNALQVACSAGNLGVVQYLAEQKIFDIEEKNESKKNLFHYAVRSNRLDLLEYVFEKGISIDDRDRRGNTPLMAAAEIGSLEVFKFFVEKGADLNAKNIKEFDSLFLAAQYAAQFSTPENCQFMLDIGLGFDVLTKDGGNALHQTCVSGNLATAKFILDLKCLDVNATMKSGKTALMIAAGRGHLNLVKLLLENGADINIRNHYGSLAFHEAAANGDLKTVEHLLSPPVTSTQAAQLPSMATSVTSVPRVLLAACVLLAAISASHQQKRAIDCRRFVFAPICRGVAAKRSDPGLGRFVSIVQHHHRQAATASPEVRELAVPAPQVASNEQDLDGHRDTAYRLYIPARFPAAPHPEYEY